MIAHSRMYLKVFSQENLHVNFFKHEKQAVAPDANECVNTNIFINVM